MASIHQRAQTGLLRYPHQSQHRISRAIIDSGSQADKVPAAAISAGCDDWLLSRTSCLILSCLRVIGPAARKHGAGRSEPFQRSFMLSSTP